MGPARILVAGTVVLGLVAACGGGPAASRSRSPSSAPPATAGSTTGGNTATAAASATLLTTSPPAPSPTTPAAPPTTAAAAAPVIVIDPGHSPAVTSTDPATGLVDSDGENEPEMTDVFAVAQLVRARLEADGYRVVLTKQAVGDRVPLAQRAAVATRVHAALALSVHDQAGAAGGIGFDAGNDIVYTQSVGGYRETPSGARVTFTDQAVADASHRCGVAFQAARSRVEGHPVRLQGDVGYDLGSRGLAPGDMWMVQLLSTVPWIYNEAGGNSPGMSGLDATDQGRYAAGLVAGVEACVPLTG